METYVLLRVRIFASIRTERKGIKRSSLQFYSSFNAFQIQYT